MAGTHHSKPYAHGQSRDIGGATLTARGPFGGETITVDCAKGHPDNPFADDELTAKFAANVKLAGWSAAQARDASTYLLALDRQHNLAAPVIDARR